MGFFGSGKKKANDIERAKANELRFKTAEDIEAEIENFSVDESPSSTILSPQELYLLRKSGYEPIQVVFGNVVYAMGLRGLVRTVLQALQRGEMVDFTRLNRDARIVCRNRLLQEAQLLGASSVVGIVFDVREYADFMEVVAVGTAVRRLTEPMTDEPQPEVAVGI